MNPWRVVNASEQERLWIVSLEFARLENESVAEHKVHVQAWQRGGCSCDPMRVVYIY